ncbi:MAG: DNA-directed RNA polymerase subunit omega [Firmicutes bacterium]|nr:DNA-directed RNA polymerase subunit omega [Bacillota bacterium]
MLRPSYAELMDVLNKDAADGSDVKSRYTVVIAAAKRARQLIDGHKPMIDEEDIKVDKAMSIAVQEMYKGKIEVVPEGQGTVLKPIKRAVEEEENMDIKPDDFEDENDEAEDIEAEDDAFEGDDDAFADLMDAIIMGDSESEEE